MRLLKETERNLKDHNKTWDDVDWIGGSDYGIIPLEHFKKIANVEYDSGYGLQEVAYDLIIVFKDGAWLEREEYDGSEWWVYKKSPVKPENIIYPEKIVAEETMEYCRSIHDLNNPQKYMMDDDEDEFED